MKRGVRLQPSYIILIIMIIELCHLSIMTLAEIPLAQHQFHKPSAAFGIPIDATTIVTQLTSAVATYVGFIGYFDRPRGKLTISESSIEPRQSQVEGAGLGLYVKKSLPENTILGTYPGVIRPANNYMRKYSKVTEAGTYAWRFTDNEFFIDPTSSEGLLYDFCLGGTDDFPLSYFLHEKVLKMKVPTLLARINEPPIGGGGCNVRTEENKETREVVFSLSRDVTAGEELFMDYGLSYDRSSYS